MKKNLAILLFFAFFVNARADILVEPYVGFALSGTQENSDYDVDEDYGGSTIGGRLGWQYLGLFAGADYRMSTFDIDGDDFKETQYSAVVGYDFPILVRVWGQFVLGGEGDLDNDNNTVYKKPTGTILGVGFTGLPFVSINLEMANYTYEEFEGDAGDDDDSETDHQHILLSASLPLTF